MRWLALLDPSSRADANAIPDTQMRAGYKYLLGEVRTARSFLQSFNLMGAKLEG